MHILIISSLYPPEVIGGAEKHAAADANILADKGHNISVITTGSESPVRGFTREDRGGVEVYRTRPMNLYAPYNHQEAESWKKPLQHLVDQWNVSSFALIRNKIQDLNPDIIHIHNYAGLSKSMFSAAGAKNVPVVHTLHDYHALHVRPSLFADNEIIEPGPLMNVYQWWNDRIIGSNVDKILSPSQFVIDKHHEEGVFTDVPTERLPLGIDTDELDQHEGEATDSSSYRLLYAGQLTYSKGIDVLIDAVKQIDDDNLELHILGKGPERESLEARATGNDQIKFHGFVSEDELVRQYAIADFTVIPSRWYDNSPMVIYESYAQQTPVIGADIGGIPELIDEDETGYSFKPACPDALADVIEVHRDDTERLSENLADVDVSLDTHINRLTDVYEALMDF